MTPSLSAVSAGHLDCAKLLLDSGANVNSRDMHQRCCLHLAVENKKLDMLMILLSGTGNELVNVGDQMDRTPLHYATLVDDVKVKGGGSEFCGNEKFQKNSIDSQNSKHCLLEYNSTQFFMLYLVQF